MDGTGSPYVTWNKLGTKRNATLCYSYVESKKSYHIEFESRIVVTRGGGGRRRDGERLYNMH
jgi:hypothetical protein